MAIIAQKKLFKWKEIEDLGDLERLDVVLKYMPDEGLMRELREGFEHKRRTLKYCCPAKHYGYACSGERWCAVGKAVRISLEEDRRVFTPMARSSYRWKSIYKKRTAVERINSRLDVSFGFEQHYIRGRKKMKLRVSVAMCFYAQPCQGCLSDSLELITLFI
jgi:hypothetical protein